MDEKFIRIVSPFSVAVIGVLDVSIIVYGYFAAKKIIENVSFYTVFFVIIELAAFVVSVLASRDVLRHGIIFREHDMEFTGLDENNVLSYADIERIETNKDNKPSLKKNFVERYSSVIFYMKDDSVVTVELGLTTRKALVRAEAEIRKRIG